MTAAGAWMRGSRSLVVPAPGWPRPRARDRRLLSDHSERYSSHPGAAAGATPVAGPSAERGRRVEPVGL